MTMDGYEAGCDMTRAEYEHHMMIAEGEASEQYQAMKEQQAIDRGVEAQIEQHQHLEANLRRTLAVVTEFRVEMSVAAAAMRGFVEAFYGDDLWNDEDNNEPDETIDTPF